MATPDTTAIDAQWSADPQIQALGPQIARLAASGPHTDKAAAMQALFNQLPPASQQLWRAHAEAHPYQSPWWEKAIKYGVLGTMAVGGGLALAGAGAGGTAAGGGSALLGEGGTAAGLSSAGATTGLISASSAPVVAGSLAGAAAATPAALSSSSLLPAGSMVGATVPGAGASGTLAAAGGGGAGSLFRGLTGRDYLDLGLSTLGSVLASRQVSKATDAQLQASREALAQNRAIYDQQRSDLSPWVRSGGGAVNSLNYLMGIQPSGGETVPSMQATAPGAQASQIAGQGSGQNRIPPPLLQVGRHVRQDNWVLMQAPSGEQRNVPENMVPIFEQHGAKRL